MNGVLSNRWAIKYNTWSKTIIQGQNIIMIDYFPVGSLPTAYTYRQASHFRSKLNHNFENSPPIIPWQHIADCCSPLQTAWRSHSEFKQASHWNFIKFCLVKFYSDNLRLESLKFGNLIIRGHSLEPSLETLKKELTRLQTNFNFLLVAMLQSIPSMLLIRKRIK